MVGEVQRVNDIERERESDFCNEIVVLRLCLVKEEKREMRKER